MTASTAFETSFDKDVPTRKFGDEARNEMK